MDHRRRSVSLLLLDLASVSHEVYDFLLFDIFSLLRTRRSMDKFENVCGIIFFRMDRLSIMVDNDMT